MPSPLCVHSEDIEEEDHSPKSMSFEHGRTGFDRVMKAAHCEAVPLAVNLRGTKGAIFATKSLFNSLYV